MFLFPIVCLSQSEVDEKVRRRSERNNPQTNVNEVVPVIVPSNTVVYPYNNNFYNPYNPYVPYRSFRNNSGYYGNDYYGGNGNYSRNPIELNVRLGLIGGVSSPSSLGMYTTIGGHKNFIYLSYEGSRVNDYEHYNNITFEDVFNWGDEQIDVFERYTSFSVAIGGDVFENFSHFAGVNFNSVDKDLVFYDEISEVKILREGSTTTSAAILYDILRKISSNSELSFDLKSDNKLSLKSENSDFSLLCLPTDNFPSFADEFEGKEISLNNNRFLKLLNKTRISISNDDTRHYLNGVFLHLTEAQGRNFLTGVATDSHRLSSSSLEIENAIDFTSLILPRKTVYQLCSLLAETSDELSIQTSDNKIKFSLGYTKLISKVIDGKFPDYKKVVPTTNDKNLIVSSKDFINSIERVASVSLDRKEGVKLTINNNNVQLSVNSANSGEGNEKIKAEFNSDSLNISFNSKYLIDIASEVEDKNLKMILKDSVSPVLVEDVSDKNSYYVIMPMKI